MKDFKIFEFFTVEDFGVDYYFTFLSTKKYTFLQVCFSITDFPSNPYIQVKSGMGCLLNVLMWAWRLGLDISIFDRSWNWVKGSPYHHDLEEEDD